MNQNKKGVLLTLAGGTLWGFSGTCGQYLMQIKGVVPELLVPVRLVSAGLILLFVCCWKSNNDIFRIFKVKKDFRDLLIFGICGMSMCQFTYFMAIGNSNAGTATVLQYIGPVLIMIYVSVRSCHLPSGREVTAICGAVLGTILLATHGRLNSLVISKQGLIWGLLSAVALAVYTVQPGALLKQYGSAIVTAWGMLIGGIMLCFFCRPFSVKITADLQVILGMAAVVIIGTVVAFSCYMEGIRLIGPKKGSLCAAIEPVSATLFSVLWMNASFSFLDFIGFLCIISTIFLLSMSKE